MNNQESLLTRFFRQAIHHKQDIILGFRMLYMLVAAILVLFAYWTAISVNRSIIYSVGTLAGQVAVVFFCLSILPGILRRFGVKGMMIAFLTSVRRQVGVSMFLFAFLHYASLRLWPFVFGGMTPVIPPPVFELLGVASLYALAPLFITSNDLSVKKLGVWWRRIHAMVYFVVWLIFAHVALQEFEGWAIVLGIFALLEAGSLFYAAGHGNGQKSQASSS